MARKSQKEKAQTEVLLKPREAALELRISFPTIKQWIYKKKIRSVRTAGGHHRIPQSEVDRMLFRPRGKTAPERTLVMRRPSASIAWREEEMWVLATRRTKKQRTEDIIFWGWGRIELRWSGTFDSRV